MSTPETALLEEFLRLRGNAAQYGGHDRCLVAPSPELRDQIQEQVSVLRSQAGDLPVDHIRFRAPVAPGLNDGLIYPGSLYPLGTPLSQVRIAALERAPLAGTVRVVVVLVQFSDKAMTETRDHFDDLFFSVGVLPNGSVREYYKEVTNDAVDIVGQVVGPYTLPQTLVSYAHDASGTGVVMPNARTMARDAAIAADADVNFAPFDNDHDGFVDAFIVIHAGPGAEVTGSAKDIWSHKWVLPGSAYQADGARIYAYLTVPEDSKIGVSCHELGHLLFGFPDLYDVDYSSEGVGNWCLMGAGNWNGGGEIPAHPSAWCKANQNWATVVNQTANATVVIPDVQTGRTIYRLWKGGAASSEYFLVENRQRKGYDRALPGDGLLIWHVDDSIASNADENHYRVALVQADAKRHLEQAHNRGDASDPYPGASGNTTFSSSSTPSSRSYAGLDTCVGLTGIAPAGDGAIQARLSVACPKAKKGKAISPGSEERPDGSSDY